MKKIVKAVGWVMLAISYTLLGLGMVIAVAMS